MFVMHMPLDFKSETQPFATKEDTLAFVAKHAPRSG